MYVLIFTYFSILYVNAAVRDSSEVRKCNYWYSRDWIFLRIPSFFRGGGAVSVQTIAVCDSKLLLLFASEAFSRLVWFSIEGWLINCLINQMFFWHHLNVLKENPCRCAGWMAYCTTVQLKINNQCVLGESSQCTRAKYLFLFHVLANLLL